MKTGDESSFAVAGLVASPIQTKLWPAGCLADVVVLECQFINELLVCNFQMSTSGVRAGLAQDYMVTKSSD